MCPSHSDTHTTCSNFYPFRHVHPQRYKYKNIYIFHVVYPKFVYFLVNMVLFPFKTPGALPFSSNFSLSINWSYDTCTLCNSSNIEKGCRMSRYLFVTSTRAGALVHFRSTLVLNIYFL